MEVFAVTSRGKKNNCQKVEGLLALFVGVLMTGALNCHAGEVVSVSPGADLQSLVNYYPGGTTFMLSPGVYRLQSVVPKSYDSFVGTTGGAILNGSRQLTSFSQSGSYWVSNVAVAYTTTDPSVCDSTHPACDHPQDLFFDNVPRTRVASLSAVRPGRWYLDYNTGNVYMGDDPNGHKVEISVVPHAFSGSASHVTLSVLTIEKYAAPRDSGAIQGSASQNWVVKYCDLRLNHGMGLAIGNNMWVYKNKIYSNGELGIGGTGSNVSVQNNEIYKNNFAGYSISFGGGTKFVRCYNVMIQYNYAHDNNGPGLWADINNMYITFEHNQTTRNKVAGIFYEISYHATIRYNSVSYDGFNPRGTSLWWGAGILLNDSSYVAIYGNTVTNCMNGIGGIETPRGVGPDGQPYRIYGLDDHDNTITQTANFASGIVRSSTLDNSVYSSWDNHFQNDTYNLSDLSHAYFFWLNEAWTLATWNKYISIH